MRERIDSFFSHHPTLLEITLLPTALVFSGGSVLHKGNERFLAEQAFQTTKTYGNAPYFLKVTGWILARLGRREIEVNLIKGKKTFDSEIA